ncbi:MAG TPA: hypothetical protein VNQ74_08065, partial [Burkholderiaceae bacterium]|nr:hypothetical protein [Burkholderiaceae bacterium]
QLAVTTAKILLASAALAFVAWLVNESAGALPIHGLALECTRVILAIVLGTATFYGACRLLQVDELQEAIDAIGGKIIRRRRRN